MQNNSTKGTAMNNTIIAIMTVALVAVSAPVLAQEADTDTQTVDTATDSASAVEIVGNSSDLMPISNVKELVELMLYVSRHYYVTVQKGYVAGAKPAVAKVIKKNEEARKTNENLFESFQLVLNGQGEFVPERTEKKMLTYMADTNCSFTDESKKWEGDCFDLWRKVKNVATNALEKLPTDEFRANAQQSLQKAEEYAEFTVDGEVTVIYESLGDAIILAHGVIAGVNMMLTEEDRPWKGLGLDSKTEGTDDLKNRAEFLIGQEVCVYADEIQCDKVTDVTENGIIVAKNLVVWKDAEKAMVLGTLPESFLNGAKNPNHGFQLGLSTAWAMTSSDEGLTSAHSVNSSVMAQYNFRNVPLALRLGVGISDIVSGGLADHYLSKTLKRDRVAGQFTLGLGFVPMFTKTVGLTITANGVVTTKGGKGANVEGGCSFYLGKKIVLSPMVGFGYMDHNMVLGENEWSPLANPSVKGFTLNAGLNAAYRF